MNGSHDILFRRLGVLGSETLAPERIGLERASWGGIHRENKGLCRVMMILSRRSKQLGVGFAQNCD